MEKTEFIKVRVYYMYFWRNGKRERSPEYDSLTAFTAACGKWCDTHPEDYQLCSRIATRPKCNIMEGKEVKVAQ